MSETSKKVQVQVDPAKRPAGENAVCPLVDIYQTEDGTTVLVAEVPGASADKLDVRVDKGVLTTWADGRLPEVAKDFSELYAGFAGGEYFRAFALSDEVDREQIEASISGGLLTVRLPRAAAARTRKIQIKSG